MLEIINECATTIVIALLLYGSASLAVSVVLGNLIHYGKGGSPR